MNTPSLKPIELKRHTCKQGHYGDIVPKLPMRSMLVGPSGSGKTVPLTNMVLDIYKGCLSRIYIGSPCIEVDSRWKPVKNYIRDKIKPNDREQCYFDSYEPSELEAVINTKESYRLSERTKTQRFTSGFNCYWWLCRWYEFYTKVSTFTSVIHKRKTLHDFNNH